MKNMYLIELLRLKCKWWFEYRMKIWISLKNKNKVERCVSVVFYKYGSIIFEYVL